MIPGTSLCVLFLSMLQRHHPCVKHPGLDHTFIRLGLTPPTPPTPPSLLGFNARIRMGTLISPVGNQWNKTQSNLQIFKLTSISLSQVN
jgi:hypothetical protein